MLQRVKYLDLQGEKNAFVLKIKNSSKKKCKQKLCIMFLGFEPKNLKNYKKNFKIKKKNTRMC
tara:strand:+ start:924 stop:1112 length:189 start_codon:yes stop_codon:yes gene_type:complete